MYINDDSNHQELAEHWKEEYLSLKDIEDSASPNNREDEVDDNFYADMRHAYQQWKYHERLAEEQADADDPEEDYAITCRSQGLSRYGC